MAKSRLRIQPDPDFGRLMKVLRRDGVPERVPFCELFSNIIPDVLETIERSPTGDTSTITPGL